MRATGAISKGECVAVIPRAALLSCTNNPSVASLVAEDHTLNQEDSTSSWVPLLLSLAAEYSKKYTTSSLFSKVCAYTVSYVQ